MCIEKHPCRASRDPLKVGTSGLDGRTRCMACVEERT